MKRNLMIAAMVVLAGWYVGDAAAQTTSGQSSTGSTGTTGTAAQTQGARRNRGTDTTTGTSSSQTNTNSSTSSTRGSEATSTAGNSKNSGSPDRMFARHAAEGGMAEVKLGQLAEEKGSSQAVKAFGKRMADDHNKANNQLKQVASKTNMTLPSDVSGKDKAEYDRLSKLSGPEFDRAYARMMVADHNKDVSEFQREANNGKDSDLKNFASTTLPTLQDHLKMARDMQKEVSSNTNNKNQNNSNQNRNSGS